MAKRRFSKKAREVFGYLGSNVRRTRLRRGLSQEKLAERVGVDPRFLQLMESGDTNVGLAIVVDLSTELEVAVSALLRATTIPERRVGRPAKRPKAKGEAP
jgi:transcriptional regulator with XRE-family HTH domain